MIQHASIFAEGVETDVCFHCCCEAVSYSTFEKRNSHPRRKKNMLKMYKEMKEEEGK